MIVSSLESITGTERDVSGTGWASRRLLLARDGMGFSLTDTLIQPGHDLELEYRHHFEACYCIEGHGEVVDCRTGTTHPLAPFTMYALDRHDRHVLRALDGQMRLVCVFNPPLQGQESHRADGSYALNG